MKVQKQILDACNFRNACKEFDSSRKISEEDFTVILESGRLSPSSFGFEPWRFLIVQNMELRKRMSPFCWGAQKQLLTASHYVVLLARTGADMRHDSEYIKTTMAEVQKSPPDVIVKRLERLKKFQEVDFDLIDERALFDWACKQTYIALANMMTSSALLGIDSCPIEGFCRKELEKVLIKEGVLDNSHFSVACMVAFGYRVSDPKREKTRRSIDEVTDWLR